MPLAPCSELFANTGSEPSLCTLREPSLDKKALKDQNENELRVSLSPPCCQASGQLQRLLVLCAGIWLELWDWSQLQGVPSQLQGPHPSPGGSLLMLLPCLQGGPGVPGAVAEDVRALLGQ